jgi:hypothetical protein
MNIHVDKKNHVYTYFRIIFNIKFVTLSHSVIWNIENERNRMTKKEEDERKRETKEEKEEIGKK